MVTCGVADGRAYGDGDVARALGARGDRVGDALQLQRDDDVGSVAERAPKHVRELEYRRRYLAIAVTRRDVLRGVYDRAVTRRLHWQQIMRAANGLER